MKIELRSYLAGFLKLEVIAETDAEYHLLDAAWKINGYERGDGATKAPRGGSTGFYVPLCSLTKESRDG